MEDVTRKRIVRKLEELPSEQLYQVLDYIEFLSLKYARDSARPPDPFQHFAERLEDRMRVRSVAPKAMKGTMKVMSTAGKVVDGVRSLGRDLLAPPPGRGSTASGRESGSGAAASSPTAPDSGRRPSPVVAEDEAASSDGREAGG
ncbi:MAG: hypothetical protein ACOCUW_03575 [Gemmatimonadota bacterium]